MSDIVNPDEFDRARGVMYEELTEEHNEDAVDSALEQAVIGQLTRMYDNRDNLEEVPDE